MNPSQSPYQLSMERLVEMLPATSILTTTELGYKSISAVIVVSGFEARCCAVAEALAAQQVRSETALIVHYDDEHMKTVDERHIERLEGAVRCLCSRPANHVGHSDRNLSRDFGDTLLSTLQDMGVDLGSGEAVVCFDITVGSSRLLLEGLHALMSTSIQLVVLYSEARLYRPFFDEYMTYVEESQSSSIPAPEFLTVGVEKVDVLRRMPGLNTDARPVYLAAFPSFSPSRIGAVLEELSPSRVHWLFGVPHLVSNRWRIEAQRDYHSALMEDTHRRCYVSTFDYRETLQVLENIYQKRRANYAMFVCSLGSKLQKVGQVMFHLLRPEVAAIASVPRRWDDDRFTNDEPRAIYILSLGHCDRLRVLLKRTRTFRV